MVKMVKRGRILSWICALTLLWSTLPVVPCGAAESAPVTMRYTFTGEESELPGYAQGTVAITAPTGAERYSLYWANDAGILPGYEKIAVVQAKDGDGTAVYEMVENMVIPEGATKLAAFDARGGEPASTDLANAVVYDIPLAKQFDSGRLEMRFASVSDVHVNYDSADPNSDNYCGAPAKWTAALDYFAGLDLDMVVVSGDCTGGGSASEYQLYQSSIDASNYPSDKIYASRGNHESQQNENYIRYTARTDMVRPFAGSPWFYVRKEGRRGEKDNLFIFMAQELSSTSNSPGQDNFSNEQLDWLEDLLAEYAGGNANIFIIQHGFYHNWGPGDRYDGVYVQPMLLKDAYTGNMRLQSLLIQYKEAVMMTGHSHIAFSEMVNFSDEKGTACRMIHNSSTSQQRTYTASGSISYRSEGKVTNTEGSEGYVVGVYANDIVYSGTNLTTRERIPTACYIFPSYTENRSAAVSIEVTRQPDKTTYNAGEYFNPAGLEVTATYADGSTAPVRGWGLKNNLSLSAGAKEALVTYGDLETAVPIHIASITDAFEGSGTKADPFLIQSADDFMHLTDCFASVKGTGSNDANTFGAGMFFRQTADIDMTGYAGYHGTPAYSGNYYGFSGVYDGNGYTVTVALDEGSRSDVSVFPYLNGVLMNTRIAGSITAQTNAQPVRTVGKSGLVLNCDSDMRLSGEYANGLSVSNYGTVIQYYSHCRLNGQKPYVYSKTNDGCVYQDCYYDCRNGSGQAMTSTNGIEASSAALISENFNQRDKASITEAVTRLQKYDPDYTADALCQWGVEAEKLTLDHIAYAVIDRKPPVILIQSSFDPAEIIRDDNATVTITVEDEGGVASVTYQIGEAEPVTVDAPEAPIVLHELPEGSYTIRVSAVDQAGNQAEASLDIRKELVKIVPGDMDKDGLVTIQDVMEACKVLARKSAGNNPTEDEMARGNLDGDDDFTIGDVMEICKILARKA